MPLAFWHLSAETLSSDSRKDGDTEGLHHHTLLQENAICPHFYALASERMKESMNE